MDALTKKRLGQYFSGSKVAELLSSLCNLTGDETVIDPMAGNGDMLKAVIRFRVKPENVFGIEIDEAAANACKKKVPASKVFNGDAFSANSYEYFGRHSWDVVITNPPYVRYQTLNSAARDGRKLKNSVEIRSSLLEIIDTFTHLTVDEKTCFCRIIKNYSGLSDLVVPSWLLCAALVKRGGVLAMVVPESWISRDYALSIKYLLLKLFDIQYIVEDMNAAWFPEALVKTNLLIARRTELRSNFQMLETKMYRHIRLSAKLIGESSLVHGLQYGDAHGIKALHNILENDTIENEFENRSVPISDFAATMLTSPAFNKLMGKLEPSVQSPCTVSIPVEVRDVFQLTDYSPKIVTLSAWGIQIGQGLRTGANKFFYAEYHGQVTEDAELLRVDSLLGGGIVAVAQRNLLPALRYQNDAADKYAVTGDILSHRLIHIKEDLFDNADNLGDVADEPLANHIAAADVVKFESGGKLVRFRDLSAVKTNIRTVEPIRRWYMLPLLAKRHLPHLCVSRVNNKSIRCLLVEEGIVVDANFSTLWTEPRDDKINYAVFALMNSSWVQVCLEAIATVMGGGALKVEATHLKMLPLPAPTDKLIAVLYVLGKQLARADMTCSSEILLQIDKAVFTNGFGISEPDNYLKQLHVLLATKVAARKHREAIR